MPYTIRKQKCKQSDGDSGSYTLNYTDKKGKKHSACHTSRKKAQGQIAAIEAEGVNKESVMRLKLSELRKMIQEAIEEITQKDLEEADKDQDDDGDSDFADVMMARMKAGGEDKEHAFKKSRKYDE